MCKLVLVETYLGIEGRIVNLKGIMIYYLLFTIKWGGESLYYNQNRGDVIIYSEIR